MAFYFLNLSQTICLYFYLFILKFWFSFSHRHIRLIPFVLVGLCLFCYRPTPRQVSIPVDSPVNNSTMVPSGDFVSDGFGLVGSISGPSSNKSRLVSSSRQLVYKSSFQFSKKCCNKFVCFFFLPTDVGGGPETPEPDEISGGGSSTHDVYSDVMGGLMGLQHVQQQPHRDSESLVGSSLPTSAVLAELLPGHSRNSSGTSHSGSGSASGYGSLASQSQHSRQSSSGELGHFRLVSFYLLPFDYTHTQKTHRLSAILFF